MFLLQEDMLVFDEEDDGIPFEEKMADLSATLKEQMEKEEKLNQEIKDQLSKNWSESISMGLENDINEDWVNTTLGEVCEIKYGKDHKKLNVGDIPCYGSGGLMRRVNEVLYDKPWF